MTWQELLVGVLGSKLISEIKKIEDESSRTGSIYATICTMKDELGQDFEEALCTFLKYGCLSGKR